MKNYFTSQFAVLNKTNKPLLIKDLKIPKLKSNQVLVKIKYSFICGTQLKEIYGLKGVDKHLPHTLGHEASGYVEDFGNNISSLKIGDRVILSWIKKKSSKVSKNPFYLDKKNKKINSGLVSTFSRYAVVSRDRIYKIPKNIPMDIAALLGCALPTGFGIVLKFVKKILTNEYIGIYGVGGVGLMCIIVLKLFGIKNIYAIDKNKKNLKVARKFGCKNVFDEKKFNKKIVDKKIKRKQIMYNFEMSGNKKMMEMAIKNLSSCGTAVLAGNLKKGDFVKLNPYDLIFGKKIFGFSANDVSLDKNLKYYLNLLKRVNHKKLRNIFKVYEFKNINKAVIEFKKGKTFRPLIKL